MDRSLEPKACETRVSRALLKPRNSEVQIIVMIVLAIPIAAKGIALFIFPMKIKLIVECEYPIIALNTHGIA